MIFIWKIILKYFFVVLLLLGCAYENSKFVLFDDHVLKSHIEGAVQETLTGKYDFLENSDNFEAIEVSNLTATFQERGTAIVLIGTPRCHNCQSLMPGVQRAAKKHNQIVYYIDISRISAEDYDLLIELLNPYLEESPDGNKSIYIPHIISIREGEVIHSEIGYTQDFDYTDIMTFTK